MRRGEGSDPTAAIIDRLLALPLRERLGAIRAMTPAQRREFRDRWAAWAHDGQTAPPGDWRVWLIRAGRGFGKTRAGAEWVGHLARAMPEGRFALVGATVDDVRQVMVEGPSGLIALAREHEPLEWRATAGVVRWPNGATASVYAATAPEKLRGPEHHFAWCDELGKWGRGGEAAWDNLMLTMRLGDRPRVLVTTTPRPTRLMRRVMALPGVVETRGSTADNPHLPESFVAAMAETYAGTMLGRQELEGELIDEVAGALWTRGLIEARRVRVMPDAVRVVVGVDPPAGVFVPTASGSIAPISAGGGRDVRVAITINAAADTAPGVRDGLVHWDEEDDVTAFDDVLFPLALGREAEVAPEFSTTIVTSAGGRETRNVAWEEARTRYDVGPGVRSEADIRALLDFFRARGGPARSFRLRDPFDAAGSDEPIGTGDGVARRFALAKHYGDTVRRITRPVAGSVAIRVGGVATTAFTLEGGEIVLDVAPEDGAAITASFDFDVPVRFAEDRLTELAVQTSSYGTQIPKLFGTMRVAGSVIWATDLVEHRGSGSGGKGRPSVTTYSYTASFAVALSARAIQGVGRIWADGKLLRGAGGDWKSATRFRLHMGGEDQALDPLIASAEGMTLTPAHRGLAYAVFEDLALEDFGNRIPSLTFEVIADAGPVTIGAVAAAMSGGIVRDAGVATAIDGFSGYGDSARGVVETLGRIGGCRFAPVGDAIEIRGPATGPPLTIEDAGIQKSRRARSIRPIETVPQSISVAHYDPARDYQTGVQRATRPGAGNRRETVDAPVVIGAGAAKALATAMLARAETERVTRRVTGDTDALAVAPGDRVAIIGEDGRWRVSGATLEGMATTLELVAERSMTLPAVASPGRSLGAPDALAGETILHAFELPALDEALLTDPRILIAAAGTGAGWRRAALRYSLDGGANWTAIGGTAAPATLGVTVGVLPVGPVTLIDRRNELVVDLAHEDMSLSGAEAGALDRGGNLALVGDELIQFAVAEQLAPRRWLLRELLRGRRGTRAVEQAAGQRFALIEAETMLAVSIGGSPGQVVRVAADAVAGMAETDVLLTGASILPPAPVRLEAVAQADGGALLTWRRRGRSGWRWRDGTETPLGEEREQYRVTIAPEALPQRTLTVETAAVSVTAAECAAGPVIVSVAQIGTNGVSPATTITF